MLGLGEKRLRDMDDDEKVFDEVERKQQHQPNAAWGGGACSGRDELDDAGQISAVEVDQREEAERGQRKADRTEHLEIMEDAALDARIVKGPHEQGHDGKGEQELDPESIHRRKRSAVAGRALGQGSDK